MVQKKPAKKPLEVGTLSHKNTTGFYTFQAVSRISESSTVVLERGCPTRGLGCIIKKIRYLKWRNPHLCNLYGYGLCKGNPHPKPSTSFWGTATPIFGTWNFCWNEVPQPSLLGGKKDRKKEKERSRSRDAEIRKGPAAPEVSHIPRSFRGTHKDMGSPSTPYDSPYQIP